MSHRVEQLADREEGYVRTGAKGFESLVPLPEVIGASLGHSAASTKVQKEYQNMLRTLGPEFEILRTVPEEEVKKISGHLIAEGIRRLRDGKVERNPGFDGEYGTIQLFTQEEIDRLDGQMSFFDALCIQAAETVEKRIKEEGNQADKPRMSVDGKEAAAETGAENVVPESMAGGEKTAGQAGSQNQSGGTQPGTGTGRSCRGQRNCRGCRGRYRKNKDSDSKDFTYAGSAKGKAFRNYCGYIYK